MQLKQLLEKCFPKQLDISGDVAPESGAFEVILLDSGELLHSKKNGDGYVDSNEKVKRICNAIRMKLRPQRSMSDRKQMAAVFSQKSSTLGDAAARTKVAAAAKQTSETKPEVEGSLGQEDAKNTGLQT
ncbi:UNVERIFIED_CONTAM: hypothetical protein K2H54_011164 [Gekko kuhli]